MKKKKPWPLTYDPWNLISSFLPRCRQLCVVWRKSHLIFLVSCLSVCLQVALPASWTMKVPEPTHLKRDSSIIHYLMNNCAFSDPISGYIHHNWKGRLLITVNLCVYRAMLGKREGDTMSDERQAKLHQVPQLKRWIHTIFFLIWGQSEWILITCNLTKSTWSLALRC